MQIEIKGQVIAIGDCGHKIPVPITRLQDDFTCPECGSIDRFTAEQVSGIMEKLSNQARDFGVDKIREMLGEDMRKRAAGTKNLSYKPGGSES